MPTICPNCLRPVRMEARYCGYCGSNLNPTALDEASAVLPIEQPAGEKFQEGKDKGKPKANRETVRRRVLISIVILLLIVLLATFVIHYLPDLQKLTSSLMILIFSR
jgi:hypothetical protein